MYTSSLQHPVRNLKVSNVASGARMSIITVTGSPLIMKGHKSNSGDNYALQHENEPFLDADFRVIIKLDLYRNPEVHRIYFCYWDTIYT